jgi:hypothetical protein
MICRFLRNRRVHSSLVAFLLIAGPVGSLAQTGGRISGTVKDPTGAVIPNAEITLTNESTRAAQTVHTDGDGSYVFPVVSVGTWDIKVAASGFQSAQHNDVVVNISSALNEDITLSPGGEAETINVQASDGLHVETADTQMGETIDAGKINSVPLNGRSYTDLLAVQAGVTPITTANAQNSSSGGSFATAINPSGGDSAGQYSISGQRESANGFVLNGANVVEAIAGAAAVVPNLDSIGEFRILTTNSDAEYGNYAGGLISVTTKAGSNNFHGSVFEFLRNTDLDARGYFDPARPKFIQNQFGATFGGPILHDKVFFFVDYQGTRNVQGIETAQIPVPSAMDRTGNLSDVASMLEYNPASGSQAGLVQGSYFAGILSQRLGYPVSLGEPYYSAGCISSSQCVFPNAVIPQSAWSAPAKYLLQYIPAPNNSNGTFQTAANDQRLTDNKGSVRVDGSTRIGTLTGYYFDDPYSYDTPYSTAQGGANVPGFGSHNQGRAQLFLFDDTLAINNSTVNEVRLSYMRDTNLLGQAMQGVGISPQAQGFAAVANGGLLVQNPATAGIESTVFNNYTIGTTPFSQNQTDSVYETADNFTHTLGHHTLKFGVDMHFDHVKQAVDLYSNGQFSFFGTETGLDFADFLIGIPSVFSQGYTPPFHDTSRYAGLYGEDSWKVSSSLVLNYGLRWEYIRPWSEQHNLSAGLIEGENSQTFPGAPTGLVFPGDNGIPSTIAPTPLNDFSPRIGLAWSPTTSSPVLNKLTGGPGNFSLRAGFGRYFTAIEGAVLAYSTGDAPYGSTYTSTERPLFESPFIGAITGTVYPQPFPLTQPPANVGPRNPYTLNWSQYEPISGEDTYYVKNRTPYAENYFMAMQRQLAHGTLLSISYVGSEGHHLITLLQANPGNPSACLAVSQASEVAPGSATCGPFGENGVYTAANGTVINGTRGPFGNNFGSSSYFYNYGNSVYNSMQITVNHSGKRLTLLGGYTYGKSIDNASSLQEQLDPYDHNLRRGISSFDLRHSFVASYRYALPFDQIFTSNRLTDGWAITGITRFSTGVPVTLFTYNDNSLLGTGNNGVNNITIDEPDVAPGNLGVQHNPRRAIQNNRPYFNTSLFTVNALGDVGDAKRRFFYGPGIENWDMALLKTVKLTEAKALEMRLETFNIFNHTQFDGAGTINGNFGSSTFGAVQSAASPRLLQLAAKFNF